MILCDVPIRFDTYRGCSHGCLYCFVTLKAKTKRDTPEIYEGPKGLSNWIKGFRPQRLDWCDWEIPLHWGGMSDPFQPCEREIKNSLQCLEIFAETQYPVVISTKGKLIAEDPYLSLVANSNSAMQISLVSPKYDELEVGAPSYIERLKVIEKLSGKAKRVIVRVQPYMLEVREDVRQLIKTLSSLGVYGITIEGLKLKRKQKGLERVGGDFVYPLQILQPHLQELKEECHSIGLKFYCGENRLRFMGDDLCCCGVDGLQGFEVSTANLNHYLYDPEGPIFTQAMNNSGTGEVFINMDQRPLYYQYCKNKTYKEIMEENFKDKNMCKGMGYDI